MYQRGIHFILVLLCIPLIYTHSSANVSSVKVDPTSPQFYNRLHQAFKTSLQQDKVDYNQLKKSKSFYAFIESLRDPLPPVISTHAELAYWINAYNALTLFHVLNYWPNISSVKTVVKGSKPYLFFKERVHKVAGKYRSLDDIEHLILRVKFADPRIHAALNCASISCPPLRAQPYTAERIDQELNEQFARFVNDSTRNDLDNTPPRLSKIFKWYEEDFSTVGGVRRFIAKYISTSTQSRLLHASTFEYLPYNWNLNQVRILQ